MAYLNHKLIASGLVVCAAMAYPEKCELENEMIKNGLVNIAAIDSTIKVTIFNASTQNMLGENTYGCLTKCYLRPEAAEKLKRAQKILKDKMPGHSLKILEGARPRRVQRRMYDAVKNMSIKAFVADPQKGSMHNFGTAVDITIVNEKGIELDMGKPDPRIKILGKSDLELRISFFVNSPNNKQKKNRELLRSVMMQVGFIPLDHEWWHFEAFEKEYVRKNFKIIE
jgi:D-alanyl-D-alanine dipeptidase